MIDAYARLGSYRAAAALCGTTHKTVRRAVERHRAGGPWERRPRAVAHNTDAVRGLIADEVRETDGRITAKRLLQKAGSAGYTGSARSFRRAVAKAKADWRRRRRAYRPWRPEPGEHLLLDWGEVGELKVFCAVLAWSRYRFVRFTSDMTRLTTQSLLAECLEELGAVPSVVLSDRMSCLRNGPPVANVVVPHPEYVRMALHYGFRPDFCESKDPESKGAVEHLVGYAKQDLPIPADHWDGRLAVANRAARVWCSEVNGRVHSETQAVPSERLGEEREVMRPLPNLRPAMLGGEPRKVDKMQTVRFASGRYSLAPEWVGKTVAVCVMDDEVVLSYDSRQIEWHPLVAPGEASIKDEHYPNHSRKPRRPIRAKTATEREFLGLGEVAEQFLRAAAAAGTSGLAGHLADIVTFKTSWGEQALTDALERAVRFHRYTAEDVRDILAAGSHLPEPTPAGERLSVSVPEVPTRSLDAYAMEVAR